MVKVREYQGHADFERVGQFLVDTYCPGRYHENWLQPRWEYLFYHSSFDEKLQAAFARCGVWESGGHIVAAAHFELDPGEVFLQVHPDYEYLKLEMLEYAENNLCVESGDGQRRIAVWVNDFDLELKATVMECGYRINEGAQDCWSILEINSSFTPVKLPDGFRMQSLADENDLKKLHKVIYRGFNHPGEPTVDGAAGIITMQSAPHYRKDLNIVIVAPDGAYASYCGMWQDRVNRIAYVEPVCTDPDYSRLGLGAAAVLEGIRRCGLEGAETAMVGSAQPFYLSMDFTKLFDINLWTRSWT